MKSLPEMISDLQGLSSLLLEASESLSDLAKFFGGGSTASVAPKAPAPSMLPPRKRGRPRKTQDSIDPFTKLAVAIREAKRELQPEEKKSIVLDWSQLPERLRTKGNRAALARKYKCSPLQIFALTRTDGHIQRISKYSPAIKRQESTFDNPATLAS